MGKGFVPGGPSAVYAVALATLLVLSVVSPVLAASVTGDQTDDGLLGSPDSLQALTETVSLTETLTATETLDGTTETLNETTNNTTETLDDTTTETTETLNETTTTVDDTVENTTTAVEETVDDTAENTSDTVDETVDGTTDTVNETVEEVNETEENTTDDDLLSGSSSPQTATVTVENATAGKPVTADVSAADTGTIGVSRMTIVPERDGGFTLNVTASDKRLSDAPEFTRRDGGVALGNIRVNHTIADENISNVTFIFSLSAERLEWANATPDEVALYRYHNGSWNALETEFLYEEDGSYVFRAESPGLSDFTAAAQKPEFELTKTLVEPKNVHTGENVDVRVRIHNVGDAVGSYTAELLFDDEIVATKQVTIAANGTRQVSFTRVPKKAGTYEVEVNNESAGTLSVETATANATQTSTAVSTTDQESPNSTDVTRKSGPGFGAVATILALLAVGLVRRD